MEAIGSCKVLGKLDEYDTQLETVSALLSVITDNLLNFNHIDPYSDDPKEKRNVITFCHNFNKLDALICLSQEEIDDVRGQMQNLMESVRTVHEEKKVAV